MMKNAFEPCTEKYVKSKVSLMSCSTKLDLLAVACENGDLVLYRLVTVDKLPVWILPVPESGVKILSICWRPDGKVIAVGYDDCKYGVRFVYMEKAELLWSFSAANNMLTKPATMLKWIPVEMEKFGIKSNKSAGSLSSEMYLPDVPPVDTELREFSGKYLDNLGENLSHILLMCDSSSCITIIAKGIFPIVKISCCPDIPSTNNKMAIGGLEISSKLDFLCLVLEKQSQDSTEGYLQVYDLEFMSKNLKLYDEVAEKALKISSLTAILGTVFDCMNETCDTVTQEVESQLTDLLVKKNPNGLIGDDFIQFLIWGKPSESLKTILTFHFTKKQIKKLGQLVESSYSNIQRLLIVNFQTAADALYYHCLEIKGIISAPGNILSFLQQDIDSLIMGIKSLMLKTTELLHVISTSLKNYKAFFRWLYVSMLKLQDEPLDKLGSMSENEIAFIADFIYEHFSVRQKTGIKKDKQFNLEKVYQYLKDEPLTIVLKNNANEWASFVSGSSTLSNSKLLVQDRREASLRQLFNELSTNLQVFVSTPKLAPNELCSLLANVQLFDSEEVFLPKSRIWLKPNEKLATAQETICVLITDSKLPSKLLRYFCIDPPITSNNGSSKGIKLSFNNFDKLMELISKTPGENLTVVDFDSYNSDAIIVLLSDGTDSGKKSQFWLAQVDLSAAQHKISQVAEMPNISEKNWIVSRELSIVAANQDCVDVRLLRSDIHAAFVISSMHRKVACVLSTDGQMIFPYLLDSTEEEEESLLSEDD